MMEPTPTDVSRLVSDLEGLARVVASTKKRRNPAQSSSLPSLEQLYRLGLVLFQINKSNKRKPSSIDSDPVATAYRELIESLPDESLRSLFDDLRRAVRTLLETANKSTPPSIGTTSHTNDSSDAARDLALAVRSIEGLIGAFSDSDSRTCRENESNSRLCRVVYDKSWISTLSGLYDRFVLFEKQHQNKQRQQPVTGMVGKEIELTKTAILSCLSRLMLDGLILAGGDGGSSTKVEEALMDSIQSMEVESTDCMRDLQEWQTREEPFRRNLVNSLRAIGSHDSSDNNDSDEAMVRAQQREYIASILESARGEPSSMAVPASSTDHPRGRNPGASTQKPSTAPSSAGLTELDRRVQQVLQILPHFGEGFVEVALGLHKGEVEATVATLLNHPSDGNPPDSSYPTALRVLDPKLPRRKREFQAYQTAEEEAIQAEAARKDVKERMALEEKQKREQYEALVVVTDAQQQEAAAAAAAAATAAANDTSETKPHGGGSDDAVPADKKKNGKSLTRKELRQQKLRKQRRKDEYDDDYDDQYDEIDIRLGAADDGFTTDNYATFEQVKIYNKIVQEDESDAAFWESNRNTNQTGGGKSSSNSNGEKKWGPDKIKGGRIIGADGKIVRKPGGVKKKKTNNNRNNNNNNANTNNNSQKGKPNTNNNSNNSNKNNANAAANNGNKKKPKTKPRSDNRVNRQRDRKMKKQGTFGVQD